jgi:hypothetical protein
VQKTAVWQAKMAKGRILVAALMAQGIEGVRTVLSLIEKRHGIFVHDLLIAAVSVPLAVWMRTGTLDAALFKHSLVYTLISASIFLWLQLYRSVWHYFSLHEFMAVCLAAVYSCGIYFPLMVLMGRYNPWPRSTIFVIWAVTTFLLCLTRVTVKFLRGRWLDGSAHAYASTPETRLLLLGSAKAIQAAVQALGQVPGKPYQVLGCLDTPSNALKHVDGVRVLGTMTSAAKVVEQLNLEGRHPHHVVLLDPISESAQALLQLTKALHPLGVCLSHIDHLEKGHPTVTPFVLEELLRRSVPHPKKAPSPLRGKEVLLVHAGQPLMRAVASYLSEEADVRGLTLCDLSETLLWETQHELPALDRPIQAHLLLSRDQESFEDVMTQAKPAFVIAAPSLSHASFVDKHLSQAFTLLMKEVEHLILAAKTQENAKLVYVLPGEPGPATTQIGALYNLVEAFLLTQDATVIRTGHLFEDEDSLPSRIEAALDTPSLVDIPESLALYRSLSLEMLGERLVGALSGLMKNPLEPGEGLWLVPDLMVSPEELVVHIQSLSPHDVPAPTLRRVPVGHPFLGTSFEVIHAPLSKTAVSSRYSLALQGKLDLTSVLQSLKTLAKAHDDKGIKAQLRGM